MDTSVYTRNGEYFANPENLEKRIIPPENPNRGILKKYPVFFMNYPVVAFLQKWYAESDIDIIFP